MPRHSRLGHADTGVGCSTLSPGTRHPAPSRPVFRHGAPSVTRKGEGGPADEFADDSPGDEDPAGTKRAWSEVHWGAAEARRGMTRDGGRWREAAPELVSPESSAGDPVFQ